MASSTSAEEPMAQRTWVRLHASKLRNSRKWGRLPMDLRGVWTTVLVLAVGMEPEAEWREEEDLAWLLSREGMSGPEASAAVAALAEAGWLDRLEGGGIRVHQWGEHQPRFRGPSDDPEAMAERARINREVGRLAEPVRHRPTQSDSSDKSDRGEETRGDKRRGEDAPPERSDPEGIDEDDPLDAYYAVTLRYPNNANLRAWIERIAAGHSPARFRSALQEEHRADPSPRDLLSRVEVRLNRSADKARRGVDKASKMEPRPRPVRVPFVRSGDARGADPVVPGTPAPGGVDRGRGTPTRLGGIGLPAVLGGAGRLGDPRVDGRAVRDPDRGGGTEGGPGGDENVADGGRQHPMDRAVH